MTATWTITPLQGTGGIEAARRGRFVAVFAGADDAAAFYDRLAGNPDGFYVAPGTLRRNRSNGRLVAWEVAPDRIEGTEGSEPRWLTYWNGMCETVGYYGSTFGEYPFGAGRRTAYLNGRRGPATM